MNFIRLKHLPIYILFFLNCFLANSVAENLNKIIINGNDRIADETILSFLPIKINDNIDNNSINETIKELYRTNFFKNVSITFNNNLLKIDVIENPIIQNITYNGIKSDELLKNVTDDLELLNRSSFVETFVESDRQKILDNLQNRGYFFSDILIQIEELSNNRVNLIYNINLGNKAKIAKISFLGNKIFKDKELKRIILSEEYKFWKFISGKKYLNKNLVEFDKRLLENFYKNNGYYNVNISSSFAKLINVDEFELIFNINSGEFVNFGNLYIDLPLNYDEKNFIKLNKTLKKLEGKPYSINSIEKITNEIDLLALSEQYETIDVDVIENLQENNLNLNFIIKETDKSLVKTINIFGNNITRENVIRNQFEIDEGDFYNEILMTKTINNLRSLNFFKNVNKTVINDSNDEKIINISIEEKPTGEIGATAGVGNSGNSLGFFINENNYLGKGLKLSTEFSISDETVKGSFFTTNPNYNDTNKSVYAGIDLIEIDRLKNSGYKTSKQGFLYGTDFELFDDLMFGIGNSNYIEKIETDSTASLLQRQQEGNYLDSFINFDIDYDKRNQKFRTTDGFRTFYKLNLPLISDTNTFTNSFTYSYYTSLYKNNTTTFSFNATSSHSLSGDNIKLTERNFISSKNLRGFELAKVGPKDGEDYIGGNYTSSFNIRSTLPQILKENQDIDFGIFLDAANVWGVDYSSSISQSNKIRSSTGLSLDWFSPLGPLNFSVALPITKAKSDKTETFRFNLGTTF
jgi:outer membrane protein insertion porin family